MKFQLIYGIHTIDLSNTEETLVRKELAHERVKHTFKIEHAVYNRIGKIPPYGLEQKSCIKNAQEYALNYILPLNPHQDLINENWGEFAETGKTESKQNHGYMKEIILEDPFEIFQRHYLEVRWDDSTWGHWFTQIEKHRRPR